MVELHGRAGRARRCCCGTSPLTEPRRISASVVHLADGGEPVDDVLQFLFDAMYEADASLADDTDLQRYPVDQMVVAVDDADVPGATPSSDSWSSSRRAACVLAATERNLWGETALGPLPEAAAVALFERGLGRP